MQGQRTVQALAAVLVTTAVGLAAQDVTVHFGAAQPQTPDPAPVGASVTHFLDPDDITVPKGAIVNFVVNGGGHGIAIHTVSKDTTRADIAATLCDGATPENPDRVVDRRNRAAVCNGTVTTATIIDGTPVTVTGTQNLNYLITDGKGHLIIESGFNVNIPPVVINNPRLDDTAHSDRLLGTSGRSTVCGPGQQEPACDSSLPGANPAGAFLTGSAAPSTPGVRISVQFSAVGRYLVVCMNRAHTLNDHMFGFVNVVGNDQEK